MFGISIAHVIADLAAVTCEDGVVIISLQHRDEYTYITSTCSWVAQVVFEHAQLIR